VKERAHLKGSRGKMVLDWSVVKKGKALDCEKNHRGTPAGKSEEIEGQVIHLGGKKRAICKKGRIVGNLVGVNGRNMKKQEKSSFEWAQTRNANTTRALGRGGVGGTRERD